MLGRAGSERAGGAEWSQNAAKAGSVDGWIQRLEIGGRRGGGYGQASKDIDWGAGRIRGGRKNEQSGVGLPGGESRPSPRRGGGRRRV